MPEENRETDMSEVRKRMDSVQGGYAESMSGLQEPSMEYPEIRPEYAEYRVEMKDFGNSEPLFLEYFSSYNNAVAVYSALTEDTDFINRHISPRVRVSLCKAYRGLSQVFWETVNQSVVYRE